MPNYYCVVQIDDRQALEGDVLDGEGHAYISWTAYEDRRTLPCGQPTILGTRRGRRDPVAGLRPDDVLAIAAKSWPRVQAAIRAEEQRLREAAESSGYGRQTAMARRRAKINLTQAEVAKRMGITPQAYADLERGRKSPTLARLRRAAKVLKCDVADLID